MIEKYMVCFQNDDNIDTSTAMEKSRFIDVLQENLTEISIQFKRTIQHYDKTDYLSKIIKDESFHALCDYQLINQDEFLSILNQNLNQLIIDNLGINILPHIQEYLTDTSKLFQFYHQFYISIISSQTYIINLIISMFSNLNKTDIAKIESISGQKLIKPERKIQRKFHISSNNIILELKDNLKDRSSFIKLIESTQLFYKVLDDSPLSKALSLFSSDDIALMFMNLLKYDDSYTILINNVQVSYLDRLLGNGDSEESLDYIKNLED